MTNLRDQRQATLGASYSIDRELGGGGMLRVYVARRSTRLRRRRQGHRAGAGGGLSGGYAHAQPNKRMDREGFARRGEQGCKAWYVDAEAELKRAEALPIPGMRRANRKDCPRSASQRAECARTSGSSSSKAAASTSTSSADPPKRCVGAREVVRASSASLRVVLARTYGCTDTPPGQSADRTI
jgi:hypothetical protein